ATLPSAGDGAEHFPVVLLGLVEIAAFALLRHDAHETPGDELAQVGVGVAAADLEPLHDLVGGERLGCDQQERVDHGHGAVDAPLRAERAPLGDETLASLLESFGFGHTFGKY